jgi:hypothetical protein
MNKTKSVFPSPKKGKKKKKCRKYKARAFQKSLPDELDNKIYAQLN